jgi:predicted alpha-1,2-mannosidase
MLRSPQLSRSRRRGSNLLAAGIGLGLIASLAPAATSAVPAAQAAAAADGSTLAPFDAVNQFIGTQLDTTQNKSNDAYGNTYPGATLPFGMVQPSPTTYKVGETNDGVREKGGYEYTADQIRGFGMTRYTGTGCTGRFGGYEFPTMPYAGALAADGTLPRNPAVDNQQRSYFTNFKHSDEVSQPGYYKVTTADGIATELTATRRTAVSRFDFSKAAGSTLILDASGANNRTFEVDLTIDPATRTVSGSMYGTDVCDNGNNYRAYFSTTYDQAFASFGTWKNDVMSAGSTTTSVAGDTGSDQRHKTGGWVTFASSAKVTAKTGFSYTSVQAAAANAAAETATSSFDDVRAAAKTTWEQALGTVDVAGGTDDERIKLYTALYHSLLQPTIGQDADGRYRGYDQAIHEVEKGHDFFRRINFAGQGWDMYRSQAQLIAMLFPQVASDINRSIVTLTQQTGKWSPGAARMSGDNYQVILSTLDAFGATDYDRQAALDSMKSTQLLPATNTTRSDGFQFAAAGFIENRKGDNATSRTLEYAADDFAVAQLAKRLGDDSTYDTFMGRSQNWQNVFDPTTQHIRPRERTGFDRTMDLRVREDKASPSRGQFNQSTGYQYGWMVTHNIGELVKRRGGTAASMRGLDTLMERLDAGAYTQTGNYLSNEAAFATPWVYHWLQAPSKTTDVLYRSVTEMYNTTPKGLPGNDDEGALSAWYVFATIGVAPMISGTANLLVTAPMFDQVTLSSVGSDRVYEINAPGVSDGKRYTTGLKVDGVAQTKSWVGEDVGRKGGTFDFTMSATPGTWGTGADDVPPSYGDGINARNNVGTSPNGTKTMASMDLSDWSFSRETLAAAGAAPGATIKHGTTGIEFTWPDVKAGQPDNWIPNGQQVKLPSKRADSISFLGLATNGPSTGQAVVQYTDGTTQDVPVTLGDWSGNVANGNTQLVTVDGRNKADGTTGTGTFKVLGTAPATLDASKVVDSVILPKADYSGVMHIFDVATTGELVAPVTPVAVTFDDQPGTSKDTYTVPAVEGVEYLVGGQVVGAGTYPGTGFVTVTARASAGAPIADGATTTWTQTFSSVGGPTQPTDPAPTDPAPAPADPAVLLGLKATTRAFGSSVPVTGTLTRTTGQPMMGVVTVAVDGRPYRTVVAFNGQFSTRLSPGLKGGTHRVTASFAGVAGANPASAKITVKVSKAKPELTLTVSKSRTAKVTVSLPGYRPNLSGKVTFKVNGKTVTATLKNGKATAKLPKPAKAGRSTVTASYTPTSSLKSSIKPGKKAVRVTLKR